MQVFARSATSPISSWQSKVSREQQVCALSLQHRHLSLCTSPVSPTQDQNQVLSVSRERQTCTGAPGQTIPCAAFNDRSS